MRRILALIAAVGFATSLLSGQTVLSATAAVNQAQTVRPATAAVNGAELRRTLYLDQDAPPGSSAGTYRSIYLAAGDYVWMVNGFRLPPRKSIGSGYREIYLAAGYYDWYVTVTKTDRPQIYNLVSTLNKGDGPAILNLEFKVYDGDYDLGSVLCPGKC